MFKNYLISGDTHGNFSRFRNLNRNVWNPEETAIFILGDAGINYNGWENDLRFYSFINKLGYTFYCVKGNHEEDPANIKELKLIYDAAICGLVYMNEEYPNIRFLCNGLVYNLENIGKTFIALGGAYSVDKQYRLENGYAWFPEEQLSEEKQEDILKQIESSKYDIVFSHTCPYSWRPTATFLPYVDQSTVDNRTELWLENVYNKIQFTDWYMGHWHTYKTIDDAKGTGHFLFTEIVDLKTKQIILY